MNIYLIAGPPGIGKSTNAQQLIPRDIAILDQDLAAYQYKKQGFSDYKDLASLSTNQRIRENLFNSEDFAMELNLGFQSHYDYLKSIASFNWDNRIHLLLFFTDDLNLCLTRAKARHLSGGHEVKPEIVEEMYQATIPLFFENKSLFSTVRLIDVSYESYSEPLQNSENLPDWITNKDLKSFLLLSGNVKRPNRGLSPT